MCIRDSPKEVKNLEIEDSHVARIEAIIRSMTPAERAKPEMIEASRRERIAAGSGTKPNEVSQLVKQFREMQRMMKRMGGMGSKRMKGSGRKGKKGKKGKNSGKRTGGGRTTESKSQARKAAAGLTLPGLEGIEEGENPFEALFDGENPFENTNS